MSFVRNTNDLRAPIDYAVCRDSSLPRGCSWITRYRDTIPAAVLASTRHRLLVEGRNSTRHGQRLRHMQTASMTLEMSFFTRLGSPSEELYWGTTTGYGVLTYDGILITDLSNWETPPSGTDRVPSGPLSNNKGQFVALVPDARFPQANDWALFTPVPVPEPSSFVLLVALLLPAIRLRKGR